MKTNRRSFLKTAGFTLGAATAFAPDVLNAQASKPASFIKQPPRIKLGIVTYNLAKDWDVPTIIKNCTETKFQGVELRTTHAHGVEVTLSTAQREA